MRIRILNTFRDKLNNQVAYIAKDKRGAARNFKNQILRAIKEISKMPYAHRKSIYFNQANIRDLIVKGYVIVYKINEKEDTIEVFGFTKHEGDPFK